MLYNTLADCELDFGAARSNYHGLYRSFTAASGDVDYCVLAGPCALDVTRRLTWATGCPALPPRWALAYSGSAMGYTDAADASARLATFVDGCAAHAVPCASFHLSSGYTTRAGSGNSKRYVFTWDAAKFPEPRALAARFGRAGVRLVANTKPALLRDHPRYAEAAAAGLLLRAADGAPSVVQWWDGLAAYVDFTADGAADWWRACVTEALLAQGVAGVWVDNCEYESVGRGATAAMFGARAPAAAARALQPLLMARASAAALRAHAPGVRPFVVSRAGGLGLQRYSQTWSGDNVTAWKTLRGNLRMSLSLALSGVSNAGHDVGGFSGPAPGAELLARWVAACALLPRFSIHSWKEGEATAPWSQPAATPAVRALLGLRALLEPQLYTLLAAHARDCAPVLAPPWAAFAHDAGALAAAEAAEGDAHGDGEGGRGDADEYILGGTLLIAPVLDPGAAERRIARTPDVAWRDFYSGALVRGGAPATLPAPWHRLPLLARAGVVLPIDPRAPAFPRPTAPCPHAWLVFPPPPPDTACAGVVFLDDGGTDEWEVRSALRRLDGAFPADGGAVELVVSTAGGWLPDVDTIVHIWMPSEEAREVTLRVDGATAAVRSDAVDPEDGRRKLVFEMP